MLDDVSLQCFCDVLEWVEFVPILCSVICFYGRSLLLCYILLILIGRRLGSSLFLGSKFVIDEYFILQFLFMSLEVPAHGSVVGS